jgi:hypothetical protein
MALLLKNATSKPSSTSRTLVYTCPNSPTVGATIFDGTITNLDNVNKTVKYITLEHEVSGTFTSIGKEIIIPYGISPRLPKIQLLPGEKLHITVSEANQIDLFVNIAER